MDAGDLISLGSAAIALVAAFIAVAVPRWTFNRTVELEQLKWVRDQRSRIYIDMLTEAYAENQWFLGFMTKIEMDLIEAEEELEPRAGDDDRFPDLPDTRLNPLDRARLGAGGTLFASEPISAAFNELGRHMQMATLRRPTTSAEAHGALLKANLMFDAFEKLVRDELGAKRG